MSLDEAIEYGLEAAFPGDPHSGDGPRLPGRDSYAGAATRPDPLSPREREVATLVARGRTNRQIAATLVISRRTAETHASHIMAKLGLATRAQIAVWAAEHGLLDGSG